MADVQMEDVAHESEISKGPSFSDEEKEILELYDQVQKLELEVALAKARVRLAGGFYSRPTLLPSKPPLTDSQKKPRRKYTTITRTKTTQTRSRRPDPSCSRRCPCTPCATAS